MNYYLGVDVGTSSVKSLLMDSEGKTVGTSQIGYDIIKEKLQYAEQDMEKLWEATKETITDLVKRYPEESAKIHGISYSGQMHGLVMIGADGKLILQCNYLGRPEIRKRDPEDIRYHRKGYISWNRAEFT